MSDQKQEQQSTLGKPMYVESLMTPAEWLDCRGKYSTYNYNIHYITSHQSKPNPFKWRYGMGRTLNPTEIENINSNLDYLLKRVLN